MTLHEINEFIEYAVSLWGDKATLTPEAATIWARAMERFNPDEIRDAADTVYRNADRIGNPQQLLQTLMRQAKTSRNGYPMFGADSPKMSATEEAAAYAAVAAEEKRIDDELASMGADLEWCKSEILRKEPAMALFRDFPATGRWWRTFLHGRYYRGVFQSQRHVPIPQGPGNPAKWRTEVFEIPIQNYWDSDECKIPIGRFTTGPMAETLRGAI